MMEASMDGLKIAVESKGGLSGEQKADLIDLLEACAKEAISNAKLPDHISKLAPASKALSIELGHGEFGPHLIVHPRPAAFMAALSGMSSSAEVFEAARGKKLGAVSRLALRAAERLAPEEANVEALANLRERMSLALAKICLDVCEPAISKSVNDAMASRSRKSSPKP